MGGIRCPPPPPLFVLSFALAAVAIIVDGITGISDTVASTTTITRCPASERRALIEFKRRLIDPAHRLSSWVGEDCCAWEGVACSNLTGHVLKLDLRNRHKADLDIDCSSYEDNWPGDDDSGCNWALRGEISELLLSLQHLHHLDLSANFFQHKPIPEFLGSLKSLTYLNLSSAGFNGEVPGHLGNLSCLHHLDISSNSRYGRLLYLKDARWISQLTSLRHLNMNSVSFANASNWLEAFNTLPRIQVLELSDCELVNIPDSLPHVNFTSLSTLDLSHNYAINSTTPDWLFNITTLQHLNLCTTLFNWLGGSIAKLTSLQILDLSGNEFQNAARTIEALSSLCRLQSLTLSDIPLNDELLKLHVPVLADSCLKFSLEELDLSWTMLDGFMPSWLGRMKNLKRLHLSNNRLYGSLPVSLKNLSLLQYLDVSSNELNETIPEGMFGGMKDLIHLDISGNSLTWFHFSNLSNLEYLDASFNHLKGTVPKVVLGDMRRLVELRLDGNSLTLSDAHFSNLSSLKVLDISYNTLVSDESYQDWIPPFQLSSLYMSFCKILPEPRIPKWIQTQRALYEFDILSAGVGGQITNWLPITLRYSRMSDNYITGHLPRYLPNIILLDLSNNSLSGQLPSRIDRTMPSIEWLDLSMNNLSGRISPSFCRLKFLEVFQIYKNKLWGSRLPNCWKNSSHLDTIDFSSNKLQGEIPRSICNLRRLNTLHLNDNDLSGQIPSSLKHCTSLLTLDLGHNQFSGNVPTWIGESLSLLQILDLHSNTLMGSIPAQLSNLIHLQILDLSNNILLGIIPPSLGNLTALQNPHSGSRTNEDRMPLFIKGREFDYNSYAVVDIKFIDLSNNRLSGHIPMELGNLLELHSLNLSKNCLTGEIPSNIKGLKNLEVLDLSKNNLSGMIPSDLALLIFLDRLNLSYNNFSGKIPTGPQLQTFDSSSYIGNPNLCGFPLSKNCTDSTPKGDQEEQEEEDSNHRIQIICLYASISLGFIVGFWVFCGTLVLRRRWRSAYFQYIDNVHDKIYVGVAVKFANLRE